MIRAGCGPPRRASLVALVVLGGLAGGAAHAAAPGWIAVDYAALVDGRRPTHSGEPVAAMLHRLHGRTLAPGEPAADRVARALLDPILEAYAFVLPDAVDAAEVAAGMPPRPWVEIGSLWHPGAPQPAWAELLRARALVVERDGAGGVRAFLPTSESRAALDASADAARRALDDAWPVLRLVLAAERARLRGASLRLKVYAFVPLPAEARFLLGLEPYSAEIDDVAPRRSRPALDTEALRAFLESGRRLEGARLEPDGALVLLGSDPERPPTILGTRPTLADLAVAYRAVFHGGAAEPYMSLDRGYSPYASIVNYGGRLRDTRLGLVALRCDVRFKTLSLGLDVVRREDVRGEIRAALPGFLTHLERLARDPASAGVRSQQTRLWFYPDAVDLTLSEQADVLVLRRVRMTAASERVEPDGAPGVEDPPWTRATVEAVNRDYDVLARLFPELGELDEVVRWLSLFAWLRVADDAGLPVPDLDVLLGVELPELRTPRTFPQLLAFNALPAGTTGDVDVFERLDLALALDRLDPTDRAAQPSARRARIALAGLDPRVPDERALVDEAARVDLDALDDVAADLLAYRAERLAMHRLVLESLRKDEREALAARSRESGPPRVFSVGIGGLDLDIGRKLRAAPRRGITLAAATGAVASPSTPLAPDEPPRHVARAPGGAPSDPPAAALPDGDGAVEVVARDDGGRTVRTSYDRDGPEARFRECTATGAGGVRFLRLEAGRLLSYGFRRDGERLTARVAGLEAGVEPRGPSRDAPPSGGASLRVGTSGDDPGRVPLVVTLSDGVERVADVPRALLDALVSDPATAGEAASLHPLPLPGGAAAVDRLLVDLPDGLARPPWERPPAAVGVEDPRALARALVVRRAVDPSAPRVALGVGPHGFEAWARAPLADRRARLLLPPDAFPEGAGVRPERLARAWPARRIDAGPAVPKSASLVVLASAEPPGVLGARLRRLAEDPAMRGRLLAVYALGTEIRGDLPASLVGASRLAGCGVAEVSPVEVRAIPEELAEIARRLAAARRGVPADTLSDRLVWYF